jgi:hypothetical protein
MLELSLVAAHVAPKEAQASVSRTSSRQWQEPARLPPAFERHPA